MPHQQNQGQLQAMNAQAPQTGPQAPGAQGQGQMPGAQGMDPLQMPIGALPPEVLQLVMQALAARPAGAQPAAQAQAPQAEAQPAAPQAQPQGQQARASGADVAEVLGLA